MNISGNLFQRIFDKSDVIDRGKKQDGKQKMNFFRSMVNELMQKYKLRGILLYCL